MLTIQREHAWWGLCQRHDLKVRYLQSCSAQLVIASPPRAFNAENGEACQYVFGFAVNLLEVKATNIECSMLNACSGLAIRQNTCVPRGAQDLLLLYAVLRRSIC